MSPQLQSCCMCLPMQHGSSRICMYLWRPNYACTYEDLLSTLGECDAGEAQPCVIGSDFDDSLRVRYSIARAPCLSVEISNTLRS